MKLGELYAKQGQPKLALESSGARPSSCAPQPGRRVRQGRGADRLPGAGRRGAHARARSPAPRARRHEAGAGQAPALLQGRPAGRRDADAARPGVPGAGPDCRRPSPSTRSWRSSRPRRAAPTRRAPPGARCSSSAPADAEALQACGGARPAPPPGSRGAGPARGRPRPPAPAPRPRLPPRRRPPAARPLGPQRSRSCSPRPTST